MSGNRKRGSRGGAKKSGPPANRKADGGGRRPADGEQRNRRPPRSAKGLGGDQVEGRHAVRELLLAGQRRVREVWVIEDLDPADILDDIEELSRELRIPHKPVTRRRFQAEALTESHQGVLARAEPVPSVELDRLARKPGAFLLVLDGVTDPGNLGAILRTAECAGVTGVVMLEFWVDPTSPYHREVFAQSKRYVFYCQSGWRSALATKAVQDMGLEPVAHLGGGFAAWTEAGGETIAREPRGS